jgi:hypothetical protein
MAPECPAPRGARKPVPIRQTGESSGRKPVGTAEADAHPWSTLCDASRSVDEVIDWLSFYYHSRLHSTLDYVSPMRFEHGWRRTAKASDIIIARLADRKFTGNVTR